MCPDSAKFITEQVYPAVKGELRDYVDITWVPFGKSSVSKKKIFIVIYSNFTQHHFFQYSTQGSDVFFNCHHGPNECYGNKVHACAIDHIQANSYQTEFTKESLTLDFIACLMKAGKNFPDNVYPGSRCARENQIHTWENIQTCANSTEGSQLLKKHGDTTMHFQNPLMSVPTVVFKYQYDAKTSERAMTNFLGTICPFMSAPQPKICAANSAVSNQIAIFVPFLGTLVYALSRLL